MILPLRTSAMPARPIYIRQVSGELQNSHNSSPGLIWLLSCPQTGGGTQSRVLASTCATLVLFVSSGFLSFVSQSLNVVSIGYMLLSRDHTKRRRVKQKRGPDSSEAASVSAVRRQRSDFGNTDKQSLPLGRFNACDHLADFLRGRASR